MHKKTISNEVIHKEIDLIQACIKRMSDNSFKCKGWLLSITAALIALFHGKFNEIYLLSIIALFCVCFWWLDAYFIRLEKLYRWKYEWVIKNRVRGNDKYLYDLNPYNQKMYPQEKKPSISRIMFSGVMILYVMVFGGYTVIMLCYINR